MLSKQIQVEPLFERDSLSALEAGSSADGGTSAFKPSSADHCGRQMVAENPFN